MIVICADGQSNCGTRRSVSLPVSHQLDTKTHIWDEYADVWRTSIEASQTLQGGTPLFTGSIPMSLAQRIANETGQHVYVMHNWLGGQPISQWVGQGQASFLFAQLKTRMTAALAALDRSTIDIHLWLQGESDYARSNNDYLADHATYRRQIRQQSWFKGPIPTVMMKLVEGGDTAAQNAALTTIANTIPFHALASGTGLAADGVLQHYTGDAQWTMGYERFWTALRSVWNFHKTQGIGVRRSGAMMAMARSR